MHRTTRLWLLSAILLLTACAAPQPRPRPPSTPQRTAAPAARAPATAPTAAAPKPVEHTRATGTPEDARRHLVRGNAAVEMAKSDADFAVAEEEFRTATEIDPAMAPAWFNLGTVQSRLGKFDDAAASYRQYVAIAPDAADAPRVRDEIIKLEFRQEQQAKTRGRAGIWVSDDGIPYTVKVTGDGLTLETRARPIPEDEVISTYTLVGSVPLSTREHATYQLGVRGSTLSGTWTRDEIPADKCTVPGESVEVSGELNDKTRTLVVRYTRTTYRAATQMAIFPGDYCGEVVATGKKQVEQAFYGPIPAGGPDASFLGIAEYWEGGFSTVKFGWKGRLYAGVSPESAAYQAGLTGGDEILSIDGVPVNTLTAGQALVRLRGEPGTSVNVTVLRKGIPEPFDLTLPRVETPLRIQ